MEITYIGHSTVLIRDENINILTDPFFSSNFSGLKRKLPPSIPVENLPKIDFLLISHTHSDHCDLGAMDRMRRSCKVIMPEGSSSRIRKMGFDEQDLKVWESIGIGKHNFTAVPAKHQGKCAGYLIKGSKTIYFAGDTFFTSSMNELGIKYNIDIAFLPIGGNRFFGSKMVMGPQEAALAAESLKSKIVIPIHYGTFGKIPVVFSMEGNPSEFKNCIRNERIRDSVRVLNIGECLNID
jgi:L-ascorbate metabolism protein UlaG (beta-lactamase superfamily)